VSLRRSSRRRRSTGDNGPKVSHYLLSRYLYILIIINNTAARARKKSLLDCIKLSWLPILRFSSEIFNNWWLITESHRNQLFWVGWFQT
jgi:hypothetical protein